MKSQDFFKTAEKFAKKCHKGQKQVTGKTYFEHPKEVARLLRLWNQDEQVVEAGYLHDVVEDCSVSLNQIEKKFGKRVAYLVDEMSWIRTSKGKDFDATYKKFANYALHEPSLTLIKLADLTANIPNLSEPGHREWVINKSYPRNMTFYIPFLKAVGLKKQVGKIVKEFQKYTKSPVRSVLFDYISSKQLNEIKDKIKLK